MRIRQVKPAFWTDSRIASMPAPVRLFYIGLWMVADDAGWFRWEPAQLGAEMYSFEPRTRREKNVAAWGDFLEEAGRIVRFACGHAFIPRMTDHQRMSSATKRVKTFEREHQACSAGNSGHPRASAAPRPVGNVSPSGTERNEGTVVDLVAGARAPRGAAPADQALLESFRRQGLPVDVA